MIDLNFVVYVIGRWCLQTFGAQYAYSRTEQALRIFEEAAELCQAEGVAQAYTAKVLASVYNRQFGEPHQEAGGIFVTLCAYAAIACPDLRAIGMREVDRVLSMDPEHFRKRYAEKVHEGLTTVKE